MITPLYKQNLLFALLGGLFIFFTTAAACTSEYWLALVPFAVMFVYAGWQNKNIIFFLLLLTLPLSFEYNFTPALGTDIPDEFLMLLVSILFFAAWLYSPPVLPKKSLYHPLLLLLIASLVWTGISTSFSSQQTVSIKFLLAKSWYAGAFVLAPLIVFRQKKNITIAAIVFTGALLLVTLITIIKHSNHGFSFASINKAVFPFFRNHVSYSAMLVCVIPLLIAFFRLCKEKNKRIWIVLAIVMVLFALIFSYARGAWLALIAGLLAFRALKSRVLVSAWVATIIIVLIALFWVKKNDRYLHYAHDYKTTIYHTDFREHLVATYRLKDVSTAERIYRWIAGVRMIKDNWLTGYGPNSFYYNYKPYAVPAFKTWVSDNKEHSTVHNYFLLTAIEQGIPGLLFFLALLGAMLYYAQRLYHRVTDVFYKTVAATAGVMVTMIIVVNFLSDLVETDKIGSLFFLCLATLIAVDSATKERLNSPPDIYGIA